MIATIIQTSWRRLRNNRSELFLTFIVPIVFFSIFAVIFGSRDSSSSTPKIKIAICNESDTKLASRSVELLSEQGSLRITNSQNEDKSWVLLKRETGADLVRRGMVSAAVVFSPDQDGVQPKIEVLTDSFDQVSSQVLTAVVQRVVYLAQADVVAKEASQRGAVVRLSDADPGIPTQSTVVAPASFTNSISANKPAVAPDKPAMPEILAVDLMGGKKTNPVIAMYAAGIAVMFLLFSATTASGSLLEELENSTLDRLLSSRLTMDQLLLGKWSYLTIIGVLQMILMFSWGALVFKIDLARHWAGFAAMSVVTAGASSSFALLLASLCKSRTQLGWVSTIVILSMSALGGSMVPRYLMSETIQKAGLWTFNAWALEGFNKVFWRELAIDQIGTELAVLTASGAVFIVLARAFAIRWERA
ncbi:ABC transporter permease [Pirellulaceae bacterium SH449]